MLRPEIQARRFLQAACLVLVPLREDLSDAGSAPGTARTAYTPSRRSRGTTRAVPTAPGNSSLRDRGEIAAVAPPARGDRPHASAQTPVSRAISAGCDLPSASSRRISATVSGAIIDHPCNLPGATKKARRRSELQRRALVATWQSGAADTLNAITSLARHGAISRSRIGPP